MTDEQKPSGWVILKIGDTYALRYSAPGGIFVAGFETSLDASTWLILFFRQAAEIEADKEFRERRARAREKRLGELEMFHSLLKSEKGKVH